VPAARSRTENWRRSLQNIFERNGALEITLPQAGAGVGGDPDNERNSNLIWRVRIIGLTDNEIHIEEPTALGQTIELRQGLELVGIIAVGQNRWMFRTTNLGRAKIPINAYRVVTGLRLAMPTEVERCQRRNFYRVSTIGLDLPQVECYPLLDPGTAAIAEAANRVAINDAIEAISGGGPGPKNPDREPHVLPQVGPKFVGSLMNVGGGGVGLLVNDEDRPALEAQRLYWLRIALMPHIPLPIGITARLRHTHIDSAQRMYAGLAFEFGFDPHHQKFVVDQLCRYVALVQRDQLKRVGENDA